MKIGIYGGTFNPIHNGHIKLAENAKRLCKLDKVIFLPSGDSYMKSNVLPGRQRYHMVSLALTGMDGMEVSDLEIRREGATYSYETMEEFHGIYPEDELFFLMGEDSLRMIELWKEPARLMGQCSLIVAARLPDDAHKQYYPDDIGEAAADGQYYSAETGEAAAESRHYPNDICGTRNNPASDMHLPQYIRYLEKKYHTHIYRIEMRDMTSSSKIRAAVAKGQEIGGMVPEAVRDYIYAEYLYL